MTMRSLTGVDFTGTHLRSTDEDRVAAERYARYSKRPAVQPVREKEKKESPPAPSGWTARWTPRRMFLLFGALAALMTVWVWETTVVRTHMIEIERLKDERTEMLKRNEAIQMEISRLSSYERIEKIAGEKLGMHPSKEKPGLVALDPDLASALEAEKNNE
jgi:cell division protein FtsL